ncbi:hypothetical protein [Halovivax limisalsi]|uniref:hypothetical protein n=1 Tax=Halovivax limisalsi TaxID=1453760 RepID=UPI001FFCCCB8|nr:hypothetical protein [Halovivax limisalsi]
MAPTGIDGLARLERGLQKFRSSPAAWFTLTGNRLVLAGLLAAVFALFVVGLQYSDIVIVTNTTRMLYLFQGLIAGNVALLTIVLSINQLVLSRELKTPKELREQIDAVIEYRAQVGETTGEPTVPVTPTGFLTVLLAGTRDTARRFDGTVASADDSELAADVADLVSELAARTAHISTIVERSQSGVFSALAATLETDFSRQLNEALRIRTESADALPPAATGELDDLVRCLKQVDIARQYFKSIYVQSELARLSKLMLYVGAPAVGSSLLLLLIYASTAEPPVTASHLDVIVPAVLILGILPLIVLFSFVLRIATIAQRTVAITPFSTEERESDIDIQ